MEATKTRTSVPQKIKAHIRTRTVRRSTRSLCRWRTTSLPPTHFQLSSLSIRLHIAHKNCCQDVDHSRTSQLVHPRVALNLLIRGIRHIQEACSTRNVPTIRTLSLSLQHPDLASGAATRTTCCSSRFAPHAHKLRAAAAHDDRLTGRPAHGAELGLPSRRSVPIRRPVSASLLVWYVSMTVERPTEPSMNPLAPIAGVGHGGDAVHSLVDQFTTPMVARLYLFSPFTYVLLARGLRCATRDRANTGSGNGLRAHTYMTPPEAIAQIQWYGRAGLPAARVRVAEACAVCGAMVCEMRSRGEHALPLTEGTS